jgi:hypothetical protein
MYVVLTEGETTIELPVKFPGFQVYVVAPVAVNVIGCVPQIAVLLAAALTVGVGLTVITFVPADEQPCAVVPTNEYVVVLAGVYVQIDDVGQAQL